MKEIPLTKFLEEHTQSEAAGIMGRSQGAVSQMVQAGRQVFITLDEQGVYGWFEIKPGKKTKAA